MSEPYRLRTSIRKNLPWFLVNLGICPKGFDCEKAGGAHEWYNKDGVYSACYHCQIVREGRLWERALGEAKQSVRTIAEKIVDLGGKLSGPASVDEVEKVESRLGVSLPVQLRNFLLQHNGSTTETDEGIWKFWPCSEITTHSEYRQTEDFIPDITDLRLLDPSLHAVRLRGDRLILFADAMIDLPTYGVYLSPNEPFHGMVFDTSCRHLSAQSFDVWTEMFITRGEDALLIQ